MSRDDHKHDHDHDHHGHNHDHHGHGHHHHHHDAPAEPAKAADEIPPIEDTGSHALSEALRSSFGIVKVLMVLLVVVFFASGVFTVGPQERAVIFRFGRPMQTASPELLGPGLHWAFPYPIDEVVRLPIGQLQSIQSTVGWYAVGQNGQPQNPDARSLNPAVDGYTLTSDGNIVHVRALLRYRISDPIQYAFNFIGGSNAVQNALDNAIIVASANFTVDRILRLDVAGFREAILSRLNQLVNDYKLGIILEAADIVSSAPFSVRASFDQVLAAEQERSTALNTAQGYQNAVLSRVEGEATARINAGRADASRIVQSAAADAQYLRDRIPEYEKNRELFMDRLLAQRMQNIMTNLQDKFFLPDAAVGGNRELRLLLNREPLTPRPAATNAAPADADHH